MEDQGAQITPSRPHHHPYNGGGGTGGGSGGGGREDCWSEGATATLIEAWGDRYLQLSRGNLRQKDWKDVADAVNMRQDGVKPRRTDVQCKNRIDTLKKKYKLEKSKQTPSKWPFYPHLDRLIGANTSATAKKITTTTPSPLLPQPSSSSLLHKSPAVTFTVKNYKEKLNSIQGHNPSPNAAVYSGGSSSKSRMNSQGSSGSSSRGGGDDDGGDDDVLFDGGARKHRMVQDSSDGAAFRELARAVLKFGEIYERIESSKQQQMMELERQRMEVMKDVEYQRMQMFMEAQLDLEKLKRPKYASSTGKKL